MVCSNVHYNMQKNAIGTIKTNLQTCQLEINLVVPIQILRPMRHFSNTPHQ